MKAPILKIPLSPLLNNEKIKHMALLSEEQNSPYVVYSLSCPIQKQIRYIGYSSNVSKRYCTHLHFSDWQATTVKYWITNLIKNGMLPIPKIEAQFDTRIDASKHELFLINQHTLSIYNVQGNGIRKNIQSKVA